MAAVPVPVRLTVCGLPVALSVRATAAVRVPLAVGLKVALIVHLAPAARLVTAVVGLCEVAGIGARQGDAGDAQRPQLPVLLRVTTCAALAVPTAGLENDRVLGERLVAGPVAGLSATIFIVQVLVAEPVAA